MRYLKDKYIGFTGCLLLTVLLLCGCRAESDLVITGGEPEESQTQEQMQTQGQIQEQVPDSAQESSTGAAGQQEAADTVFVQVSGAVRSPGVYELPAGSRVFEAIQSAGGMTDDAAADSVNQAVEVSDGDMIVLCTLQEWEQAKSQQTEFIGGDLSGPGQESDGRININTADVTQLCTIPGIGESRARSIVTYREQNGAFGAVEDIMKVSGIKDGLFQKIKDKIKV